MNHRRKESPKNVSRKTGSSKENRKDAGSEGSSHKDQSKNQNGGTVDKGLSKAKMGMERSPEARTDTRGRRKAVCRYFLEDNCRFKGDCWYSHDKRDVVVEAERMKTKLSFLEKSMRRIKNQ